MKKPRRHGGTEKKTNFVSMKWRILLLFVLVSISLSAKKFPKWKDGNFKTTSSGLQYKIVKPGKGDSIGANDSVVVEYAIYDVITKKETFSTKKMGEQERIPEFKFSFSLSNPDIGEMFKKSVLLLKENGCGYFILPITDSAEHHPLSLYFIRIDKVIHNYSAFLPIVNPPKDSVDFHLPDPDKSRFGDSLFTTMTLVEVPMTVTCNRTIKTMQAVKFRITYFENGVQHKDVLVFIDCPDQYGKDFFVAGKSYVITAIPLMENHKQGKSVQNSYAVGTFSQEKYESYYCLRIRRMN